MRREQHVFSIAAAVAWSVLGGCSGGSERTKVNQVNNLPSASSASAASGAAAASARSGRPVTAAAAGEGAVEAASAAAVAPAASPLDRRLGYDLVANLPLAHVVDRGIVADAADAWGFDKYLRDFGQHWRLGVQEDGLTVALTPPRQAQLWLPVGPDVVRAGEPLFLELRLKPIGKQGLAVFFDGEQLGESQVTADSWQTVRVQVPGRLVRPGLAAVRLYFGGARSHQGHRTAAAIRYLRLATATAPPLPEAEAELARQLDRRRTASDGQGGLILPAGGGLDYYVTPIEGLQLRAAVTGKVQVMGQIDGSAPRELAVAASGALDLSLDAFAGQALRLMLRAVDGPAELRQPHLVSRDPATAAPAGAARRPARVIFWLVDALRADKLDFYGQRGSQRPKVKTPHLSQLAAEGTVFDPFWVNSNESKASHASYFTGTFPAIHRVLNHPAKLRDSHVTIAEALQQAGYRTGAFVSNGYISQRWNYHQGFEHLVNFIRDNAPNDARAVVDKAIPWIDRHKDDPFYLYLGTADTHVTYRVHSQFIEQYDRQPYHGRYRRFVSGHELGRIKQSGRAPPLRERERIEAIYENEAAFNDHHFGRLVAHLKQRGLYDDTLFVLASDHGEEFWEHGSCGHGHSMYREMLSVPFVLRLPGVFPAGHTVRSGHDGVDLLPTLLALVTQPPTAEVQGESLLPYLHAAAYPRAMIASNEADSYAIKVGPAKVIARSASSIRVYDIGRDPTERSDVSRSRWILGQCALDPLSLFVRRAKSWRKQTWGAPNNLLPRVE